MGIFNIHLLTTLEENPLAHFCHPLPETIQIATHQAQKERPYESLITLLKNESQTVLVLEGHALNDRRLLNLLIKSRQDLVIVSPGGENPAAIARLSQSSLSVIETLPSGNLSEGLKSLVEKGQLNSYNFQNFDPYLDNLRREVPPYLLKIENETQFKEAEYILKQTVHKGVLELVAKYIHPPLEFGSVKLIAETEITPNQITLVWLVMAVLVLPLFMKGLLLPGIILSALVGVLDGVDGKLARLTLRFSKTGDRLDHVSGVIYDALWYLALGWYFSGGNLYSIEAYTTYALLGFYIIHRVVPGIFRALFGREIYDYQKIDVFARLIGARMNNNVWLLLLGILIGYPRETFYLIAIWMGLTACWFVVRLSWVSINELFTEKKYQFSNEG